MLDPKLETLLKVDELRSFTRAAEELSLTQPAVSHHMKQLEKDLNTKIFARRDGELFTTDAGEIVIKYAKRMKVLYQNLQQSLVDAKTKVQRISVGLTHTAESNLMAEVFARYCRAHEGTRITLHSDSIQNLYAKLKVYEIDLAIVEGKIQDDNFHSILLDTDSLVVAVCNENHLANRRIVTLDELKKEKMILRLPNSGTRNLFVSHLESRNMSIDEFNVILQVDNVATIKDLVRRDFGVSILAKSACMDEVRKNKMKALPIENLSMIREMNLVYHRDFAHTDLLREIAAIYDELASV